MIKVDFKKFFTDRIWFGWWCRGFNYDDEFPTFGWVRDPGKKYHWTIKPISTQYYDV